MAKHYEALIGNRVQGPFTANRLRELAQSGKLGPNDAVRYVGNVKWTRAGDVTNLFRIDIPAQPQSSPQPPPLPRDRSRGAIESYLAVLVRHPIQLVVTVVFTACVILALVRDSTSSSLAKQDQQSRQLDSTVTPATTPRDLAGDAVARPDQPPAPEPSSPPVAADSDRSSSPWGPRVRPEPSATQDPADWGVAPRQAPVAPADGALYPTDKFQMPGVLTAELLQLDSMTRFYVSAHRQTLFSDGSAADPKMKDALAGAWFSQGNIYPPQLFAEGPRIRGYEQVSPDAKTILGEPRGEGQRAAIQAATFMGRAADFHTHFYGNERVTQEDILQGPYDVYSSTGRATGRADDVPNPDEAPVIAFSLKANLVAISRTSSRNTSEFELTLHQFSSKQPLAVIRGSDRQLSDGRVPQFERLGFSPQGNVLAGYAANGDLHFIEVPSLQPIFTVKNVLTQQADPNRAPQHIQMRFSEDGRQFLGAIPDEKQLLVVSLLSHQVNRVNLPGRPTAYTFSTHQTEALVLSAEESMYYELNLEDSRIKKRHAVAGLYEWSNQVGFAQRGRHFYVQNHDWIFVYERPYSEDIKVLPSKYYAASRPLQGKVTRVFRNGPQEIPQVELSTTDTGKASHSLAMFRDPDDIAEILIHGSLVKFAPVDETRESSPPSSPTSPRSSTSRAMTYEDVLDLRQQQEDYFRELNSDPRYNAPP